MQKWTSGLAALLLAAAVCGPALAASTTEITVTGSGSVALTPDTATVSATVETNADNAARAVSDNNARYERVVGALVQTGVARSDITLSYYTVNYTPKPQTPAPGDRYGYAVRRQFRRKGSRDRQGRRRGQRLYRSRRHGNRQRVVRHGQPRRR